eukprot:scaffold1213_cov350-Prasinococcus_capsulatus_cf.AAC.13
MAAWPADAAASPGPSLPEMAGMRPGRSLAHHAGAVFGLSQDILQMQRESSEQILAANARSATLAGKVSKLEKELVDMQATSAQEKSWLETQLENANELAAKLEASITEKAKTISELTAKLPEVVSANLRLRASRE